MDTNFDENLIYFLYIFFGIAFYFHSCIHHTIAATPFIYLLTDSLRSLSDLHLEMPIFVCSSLIYVSVFYCRLGY